MIRLKVANVAASTGARLLAWLVVAMLGGTAWTTPVWSQPAGSSTVASTGSGGASADLYTLAPGDRLRITVFGEATLSGDFGVSDSGEVDLPLIGKVRAAGLTLSELQAAVTRSFANGYVNDPKVTVEATSYRPFYILGEVNKPGEYPYSVGMTVLNAVAIADGFTYRANEKIVLLKHAGRDDAQKVTLGAATPVLPGDTITIRERYF